MSNLRNLDPDYGASWAMPSKVSPHTARFPDSLLVVQIWDGRQSLCFC